MSIRTILFDADGVLQERPEGWLESLRTIIRPEADASCFLGEIFEAEDPAIDGSRDFLELVAPVLKRWACTMSPAEFLSIWTDLVVDEPTRRLVRGLQEAGFRCGLATNQEENRARFLSRDLGYADLFDVEFYSCRMGSAKPSALFFDAALRSLESNPSAVLFVDDRTENVSAARELGIVAVQHSLDRGAEHLVRELSRHNAHAV